MLSANSNGKEPGTVCPGTNFDEFARFNEVYSRRMGQCRPAREAVEVSRLALGAAVEITMTAYFGERGQ